MAEASLSSALQGMRGWGPSVRGWAVRIALGFAGVLAVYRGRLPSAAVHLHAPCWPLLLAAAPVIRLHILAATTALAVGVVLLAGVKGTTAHKTLGWTWVAAMMTTAVSSLFIRVVDPGHWSFIHFLSGWVIIALPLGIAAVRRRNLRLHRRMMTGVFVGGLVIAGGFTFTPGRLMFDVFLG